MKLNYKKIALMIPFVFLSTKGFASKQTTIFISQYQGPFEISNVSLKPLSIYQKTIIQFPYNLDTCILGSEIFDVKTIAEKDGLFNSIMISKKHTNNNIKKSLFNITATTISCRNEKKEWRSFALQTSPYSESGTNIFYIIDNGVKTIDRNSEGKTISTNNSLN